MSDENFLSDEFLRQLINVGDVDLLVGITSYNDRDSVGNVARAVEACLLRNFRRERIALVHVDAGSKDGTPQALLEASTLSNDRGIESLRTLRWITTRNESPPSSASALRTLLVAADLLHAKGCAVVSGATENATAAWIESLLGPVYRDNYDFVAPLYTRHAFDGLLTRNLLYPMCRALYGRPMRELRASEYGFSGRLAAHCLARSELQHNGLQSGAEMWMAVAAMSNAFRCCQAYLGEKPRAKSRAGVVDAIRQTVSEFFLCLESTETFWARGVAAEPLPTVGPDHELSCEPSRVDRKKLFLMFRSGVADLSEILKTILRPETHAELMQSAALEETAFRMSNSLWVRTIYEFAAAFHHSVLNRDHLIQAFVPIYRGSVCSFLAAHRSADAQELEADLESLCEEFVLQRDSFIEQWKTKGQGAS